MVDIPERCLGLAPLKNEGATYRIGASGWEEGLPITESERDEMMARMEEEKRQEVSQLAHQLYEMIKKHHDGSAYIGDFQESNNLTCIDGNINLDAFASDLLESVILLGESGT